MLTLTYKRLFQSRDDDHADLLVRMDQEQRLVQFCELEERSTRERFWAVERLKSDAVGMFQGMFSYLSNAVGGGGRGHSMDMNGEGRLAW